MHTSSISEILILTISSGVVESHVLESTKLSKSFLLICKSTSKTPKTYFIVEDLSVKKHMEVKKVNFQDSPPE